MTGTFLILAGRAFRKPFVVAQPGLQGGAVSADRAAPKSFLMALSGLLGVLGSAGAFPCQDALSRERLHTKGALYKKLFSRRRGAEV